MLKQMKLKLTVLLILCNIVGIKAQVNHLAHPKAAYYTNLKTKVLAVIPTEADLIGATTGIIPDNFRDTLLKYDWYEIANYYFFENKYKSYFLDDLNSREKTQTMIQFHFTRYAADGNRFDLSLERYKDDSILVRLPSNYENSTTKMDEVKKEGLQTLIVQESFGEKEMIKVVSYKNGVMILNVEQYPDAPTKRYHIAYLAVEKTF